MGLGLLWTADGPATTVRPLVDGTLSHAPWCAFDWLLSWVWPPDALPQEVRQEVLAVADLLKDDLLSDEGLRAAGVPAAVRAYVDTMRGGSAERVRELGGS